MALNIILIVPGSYYAYVQVITKMFNQEKAMKIIIKNAVGNR